MGGFCWWTFNCKSVILGGESSQDISFCSFVLFVTFHIMLGKHNLFASYEALMLSFTSNFLSSIANKDT